MHWAIQKRKRSAKLQSVAVTSLADAFVNKKVKVMLQGEVDSFPGSAITNSGPSGSAIAESSGEHDGENDRDEIVADDIEDSENEDSGKGAFTTTSLKTSVPSEKSAPGVVAVAELVELRAPSRSIKGLDGLSGRSLTLEDSFPYHQSVMAIDNDPSYATPPSYSSRILLGPDLPSSDPVDANFVDQSYLNLSPSIFYTWDYLDGPGRVDSGVDSPWVYNDIEVGDDLMAFRSLIVENNGGLSEPHEKLAVNFMFLVEADHQTGGLQTEVEDKSWEALCEATTNLVDPLPEATLVEAHQWVHLLARGQQESFRTRLKESPPKDPTLQSILDKMISNGQLWSDQPCNEDTYLKSQLGPFLETTQTQQETRNVDSDLLVPDFATMTAARRRQLSVVLLEGKVVSNKVCQIWDDKTKLGQELKLALDSILMLLPEDDVWVIGIFVREPRVEFYTMHIHAEATYIMRRFAVCNLASDFMNMVSIIPLMEAFQHAHSMVKKTVAAIRRVKVRPSTSPKVPLSWIRPSFTKPKRYEVLDG
ncbi:hypothetical protein EC957_010309, partial [Mortierella hygrophila]